MKERFLCRGPDRCKKRFYMVAHLHRCEGCYCWIMPLGLKHISVGVCMYV